MHQWLKDPPFKEISGIFIHSCLYSCIHLCNKQSFVLTLHLTLLSPGYRDTQTVRSFKRQLPKLWWRLKVTKDLKKEHPSSLAAIASKSAFDITPPVGLLGNGKIKSFVLSVIFSLSCSGRSLKLLQALTSWRWIASFLQKYFHYFNFCFLIFDNFDIMCNLSRIHLDLDSYISPHPQHSLFFILGECFWIII